jgi:hypothetical protein
MMTRTRFQLEHAIQRLARQEAEARPELWSVYRRRIAANRRVLVLKICMAILLAPGLVVVPVAFAAVLIGMGTWIGDPKAPMAGKGNPTELTLAGEQLESRWKNGESPATMG